jgi:hypothetical protein
MSDLSYRSYCIALSDLNFRTDVLLSVYVVAIMKDCQQISTCHKETKYLYSIIAFRVGSEKMAWTLEKIELSAQCLREFLDFNCLEETK